MRQGLLRILAVKGPFRASWCSWVTDFGWKMCILELKLLLRYRHITACLGFMGVMMKRLLASASILALSSVAVSAADLPVKAAPVLPPPIPFSWTGCYVGLHAGGGVMRDSNTHDGVINGVEGIGLE